MLDFPLCWVLPGVIKGFDSPTGLINRYEALRERALSRGELGRYLVTFVDNHDQIGQQRQAALRRRRARRAGRSPRSATCSAPWALPASTTGPSRAWLARAASEEAIREALFDLDDDTRDLLNRECRIYREIARSRGSTASARALRFGRMYFREISADGLTFGMPQTQPCTLAFSRLLAEQEVLVAYNTSVSEDRVECVVVDEALNPDGGQMSFVYGADGDVEVERGTGGATRFVRLHLAPMQLVILRRG